MKRNNILAKKRLMKTTTYMTALLVAVTMILSGMATVATVIENENVSTPTAPLSVGGDGDSIAPDEPEISSPLFEKEIVYSGSYRGAIVYDNGMSYLGIAASHQCSAYDAKTADDFVFGSAQDVNGVNWIGGFWNGAPAEFDWVIEFYKDDGSGNAPGTLVESFTLAYADIEHILLASGTSTFYEMRADLPDNVQFDGGQKYWISAWGTGDFPPQCGMGYHSVAIGHEISFLSNTFGYPTWTDGSIPFGVAYDAGFQLVLSPEHDCYADEILAPSLGSAFCPCTDVEASFTNAGLDDETDVPVSVEIRRYTMVDSFEDPFGVFWDPIPYGNLWMQSMAETAYPFVVTPRTGIYMAELDSGLTGPGNAYLDSLPIDLTGMCHPMMSFYMWHDQYGSDDFIDVQVNFVDVAGPFTRLCCPDCPSGWMEHVVDLSAYAGQSIILSFEGNCDPNPAAYNLQIDDVSIYDQEYYEEDEVDIAVGETVDVEFPQWCPCNWQVIFDNYFDVEVIACTGLETDQITSNDCVSDTITMYLPFAHDVASISIDEPVDAVMPVDTFEMCGTIKNVGQYTECCFSVYMTVEEQYTIPGAPAIELVPLEGFEGSFPPAGWTVTMFPWAYGTWDHNTVWGRTNYAGGSGLCAAQDSDYVWGTGGELFTPVFSTVGTSNPVLEFIGAYNFLSGTEYFEVAVSITGLGGPFVQELLWQEDHDAYGPGEAVSIDLTAYANQPNVCVRFTYDDLGGWDWWCQIDDVHIYQPAAPDSYDYYAPEYEDSYCIDEIDVCEEIQICFEDWTPAAPWPDCGEVTYRICLETRMCDPMDENPINDVHCELITVEFWHDVAINDITSPSDKAQTFYAQQVYPADNVISFDPVAPGTLTTIAAGDPLLSPYAGTWFDGQWYIQDNTAFGLYTVDTLTGVNTLVSNSGIGFNGIASDGSTMYGVTSTALYEINLAGGNTLIGNMGSTLMIDIAIDMDTGTAYGHDIGTDSIYTINLGTGATTLIGATGFDGNYAQGMEFDQDNDILYLALFNNVAFAGELITINTGTGAGTFVGTLGVGTNEICALAIPYTAGPTAEVWLQCGEQDFCATFENLGTFDEPGCTIVWVLNEYNTDPENPTYVTGGTETIDLEMGEVLEDYCFGSFDFVDDGYYELVVEIIAPGVDCYLDNNGPMILGLGVDCCPPETTFTIDPEQPNGENNWYTSEITVTVDAVDCCDPPDLGSGVKEIKYKVNGVEGTITGDHGTIVLEDDGVHLVELWAIDNAGNEEGDHHTFEAAIDAGDPIVDLIYESYEEEDGWHVDFTATVSDATSGIDKVEFYIGSSLESTLYEAPFVWSFAWEEGFESEDFKATVYDNAGNSASQTVDGGNIEAQPYFNAQPATPVSLVRQRSI